MIEGEGGVQLIRASQGHSIKAVEDEHLLQKLFETDTDLPHVCVHGTYLRYLQSIQQWGLVAGGLHQGKKWTERNHVHFAPSKPSDGRVISGMRQDCEVAIYLKLREAIRDGIPFYRSANQVILTPGINQNGM